MRKHEIPRKKKSETRLFVIFSLRSLASTAIGAIFGTVIGMMISMVIESQVVMYSIIGFVAFIGFLIGTIPVFYITIFPFTKSVQGMYLNEVVVKYLNYKRKRSLKVIKKGE